MRISTNIILATLFVIWTASLPAQEPEKKAEEKPRGVVNYLEDSLNEIDFYSLEEMLDMEINVASLFSEDELVVGSTVSSISSNKWKQLGARRTYEVLNNEMSIHAMPSIAGVYIIAIRGYTNTESRLGIATLIDGIPVNSITQGSAFENMPNFELGILDKVEIIKGPGSAIYGSDAFHGVLLLKTFESDKNHYSIEGAGAYPLYSDANAKISHGLYDNLIRIDAAASLSHQGDQDLEYEYEENGEEKTSARANTYNSRAGVIKLKLTPAEKLKIKLSAYHTSFKGEEFPGPHKGLTTLLDEDYSSNDTIRDIFNGSIEYTLKNNISIAANGHYYISNVEVGIMAMPGLNAIQKTKGVQKGANITVKQPDNAINLQWLIAYNFEQAEVSKNAIQIGAGAEQDSEAKGFTRTINSAFTQLKWGVIKDSLYLLAGGRLDNYQDKGRVINPKDFGTQISPRGGIIFLPTGDSSVKALYGRAFKAPVQLQLFGYPTVADGNINLEPETIDSYELLYIYKRNNWKLNISGFYSQWNNAIILERTGSATKYANKGKNDSIGGEMNFFISIDPFMGELGFSYVTSRAVDANDPGDPAGNTTADIKYCSFPEYSIQAGLHYKFKPWDVNFYLNNRIYLNMKETNVEMKPDPQKLPPYHRMDFNISKIIADKSEIFLDIRNILNRENHVPSVLGAKNGYVEPGISVMLRAGYKI